MILVFPEACITPASRLEFCYKAMENLRLLHNFFGEWWDNPAQPDKPDMPYDRWFGNDPYLGIPPEMQAKYPYAHKITTAQWKQFQDEDFFPVMDAITAAKAEAQADAGISTFWNPDFSNIGA